MKDAMKAAIAASPYVDWMEAGTPLIKSEGLRVIRELRRFFPKKTIVADMKTMDTGAFEVALAAEAGADVATVCGAADEATIKGAIAEGRKRGVKVCVDLINVPKARWKIIDRMKPDYVIFHCGIDQQNKGMKALSLMKGAKLKSKKILAGGITAETAGLAVRAGAAVVIVGGAITKAKDPGLAARKIKAAIENAR